jgi:hypothetical protein
MPAKDLWGEIEYLLDIKAPTEILREQAQLLGKKTKGQLIGKISKHPLTTDESFFYDFFINAPSLNNYSYKLFTIKHGVELYPVSILTSGFEKDEGVSYGECKDPESFESKLELIFSSPETKDVIKRLLAQTRAIKMS